MRAERLKGHLDALLLASLEQGPQHGYAIIRSLHARTDGLVDLPTGTVYPALHRLERAGLVSSAWSSHEGRRRRTYSLTVAGRRALGAERLQWQTFKTTLSSVLDTPPPAGAS